MASFVSLLKKIPSKPSQVLKAGWRGSQNILFFENNKVGIGRYSDLVTFIIGHQAMRP